MIKLSFLFSITILMTFASTLGVAQQISQQVGAPIEGINRSFDPVVGQAATQPEARQHPAASSATWGADGRSAASSVKPASGWKSPPQIASGWAGNPPSQTVQEQPHSGAIASDGRLHPPSKPGVVGLRSTSKAAGGISPESEPHSAFRTSSAGRVRIAPSSKKKHTDGKSKHKGDATSNKRIGKSASL